MVGRTVTFRIKGSTGFQAIGVVEDEVYIMVDDYKHLIQRIRFAADVSWDGSVFGYRSGYYTFDAAGRSIKWGQYTQFLTEAEYFRLLALAREKGWPLG